MGGPEIESLIAQFAKIPGLGVLASQQSKQEEDDELLILITPQVVRSPERSETPEIWISK